MARVKKIVKQPLALIVEQTPVSRNSGSKRKTGEKNSSILPKKRKVATGTRIAQPDPHPSIESSDDNQPIIQKAARNAVAPASLVGSKKSKSKKKNETYSSYIYKVLKQTNPESEISKKAMANMNSFVHDVFEKITREVRILVDYNHTKTITSREIQTACKFILDGELQKHAIHESSKAIDEFIKSKTVAKVVNEIVEENSS